MKQNPREKRITNQIKIQHNGVGNAKNHDSSNSCLDSIVGVFLLFPGSYKEIPQHRFISKMDTRSITTEFRFCIEGIDYETGLQYGSLLKDEITTMHEDFEKFKKQMMENEIQYLPWYKE